MKKIIFICFFIFCSLIVPSRVRGEQQEVDRFTCLQVQRCDEETANCSVKDSHRVKLSSRADARSLPDAKTYIIECLSTPTGQTCTTGNTQADNFVYHRDNTTSALAQSVKYEFQGFFKSDGKTPAANPVDSNNSGDIGVYEWRSYTQNQVPRKFLSLNRYIPKVTANGQGGQQQGTFSFDTTSKNCVSINWDPYGRVFDSQTLEPVPGAEVTLYKVESSGQATIVKDIVGGNVINPQHTPDNGGFTFVVPNDTYRIGVASAGYDFPNIASKLNTNYAKVYSDMYRGEDIVQSGKIEHRDIPLDSASGGKTYKLTYTFFQEINKFTGKIIIEGKASHPYTKFTVTTEKAGVRYHDATVAQADKNGTFSITVDPSTFEPGEVMGQLEVTKVDVSRGPLSSLLNFFSVFAQETSTVKLESIPNYLEGVAYDAANKPLANAKVGVYLAFSDSSFYETATDDKGFFRITSEHLPYMPYRLRYNATSGTQITVAPSKFLVQNTKYLSDNNISTTKYRDSSGKGFTDPATTVRSGGFAQNPQGGTNNPKQNSLIPAAVNQSPVLLFVVIVFLLVGAAALLLGVYLYHKNKQPLPPTAP